MELPTHCGDCGALLMGGATRHKPGCAFRALIEAAFKISFLPSLEDWTEDEDLEEAQRRRPYLSLDDPGKRTC